MGTAHKLANAFGYPFNFFANLIFMPLTLICPSDNPHEFLHEGGIKLPRPSCSSTTLAIFGGPTIRATLILAMQYYPFRA